MIQACKNSHLDYRQQSELIRFKIKPHIKNTSLTLRKTTRKLLILF